MNLQESAEKMRGRWDNDSYPKLAYVETTNFCNARCTYCLYDRMERRIEYMDVETFRQIAEKIVSGGFQIGAMFCFGEPLADATLFEKIRIGKSMGALTNYLGLNTNVSLLRPHRFDELLNTCHEIVLSFPNVGKDFERMVGLNYLECFENAVRFIEYRDLKKPGFNIQIGCNDVTGNDRAAVQSAFSKYRVNWARDAEIQWGGKTIEGVIDRSIMYPGTLAPNDWTCDGFKGAMQIKPNGDCCFCAYDVIRNETRFANILYDDWSTIERRFKELWKEPSSLCLRCDFWWNYHQVREGGWKRGPHVDDSWKQAYGDELRTFWIEAHKCGDVRWLTNTPLSDLTKNLYSKFLVKRADTILNVGVGTGRCTKELDALGKKVAVLDICEEAFAGLRRSGLSDRVLTFTDAGKLPDNRFDLALCHLVVQHMTDVDLFPLLRGIVRSLKPSGLLALQYASPPGPEHRYAEDVQRQREGRVQRTPDHIRRVLRVVGAEVAFESPERTFPQAVRTDDNSWNVVHARRIDR